MLLKKDKMLCCGCAIGGEGEFGAVRIPFVIVQQNSPPSSSFSSFLSVSAC